GPDRDGAARGEVEPLEMARADVDDGPAPIDPTPREHDRGVTGDDLVLIEDLAVEDEVDGAGLVFQGHEDDTARGGRPLAREHDPGHRHRLPRDEGPLIAREAHPPPREKRPQVPHRMVVERDPGAAVVETELLARARR